MQNMYIIDDGMSFDSAFLRLFRLQVESFVFSDCGHEEDTYIPFPLFSFLKRVRTEDDQYKVFQPISAYLGQNTFQAVH